MPGLRLAPRSRPFTSWQAPLAAKPSATRLHSGTTSPAAPPTGRRNRTCSALTQLAAPVAEPPVLTSTFLRIPM